MQVILFLPLLSAGWKQVIDHSMHQHPKIQNSGKQSMEMVFLSPPVSFETPSAHPPLFWKEPHPKSQLPCWESIIPSWLPFSSTL